jgi:hypothetical protein
MGSRICFLAQINKKDFSEVIQSQISCPHKIARFFLVRDTKTEKNVPNEHKMVIKYPKCP